MKFVDHSKTVIEDKEFSEDIRQENISQQVLRRVYGVKKSFFDVSFKQSELTDCYFRNCRFIRCDFTGAIIKGSNFRGSQYEDCKFQYSSWSHTQLDEEFLDNCLPSEENLARDLVRSLRVNFGHIGNYAAVNKAASIEVGLTGQHLFNAAYSKQAYYRSKYKGWNRVTQAARHIRWKLLDLLWGNGESLSRVLICTIFVILCWATSISWNNPQLEWQNSLRIVFQAFWGATTTPPLSSDNVVMLTLLRFILFGLFMAVLIKRLARR